MKRATLVLAAAALATWGCAGAPPAKAARAPEEVLEPVPASEAWRAAQPEPGETPALVIPTVEQAVLPNGLTVLVSEQHELPLVHVRVALRAGSAQDPEGKAGVANLVAEMLTEGAGKLDAVALAEAFGDLGADLASSASEDGGSLGVTVLARNLDPAVALLAEVALRPRFDAKDFERRKKKVLADLVRQLAEPMYLALDAVGDEVYGAKHPYGHPVEGSMASVGAIAIEDVKAFYAAHVGPGTAALVVTGDITLEEAKRLAEKHFGAWRGKAAPPAAPVAPAVSARTRVRVVAKPGLEQTMVVVSRPGIARGSDDEWALELANSVFGGMFTSRLNLNLREDKGITYGAWGWVDSRHGVGIVGAGSPVEAAATGLAVKELFKEIRDITARPITEQEFEQARDNLLRSIPGWFETGEALADSTTRIFFTAQPIDRWQRIAKLVEKLTIDDVRAAATRYFDPAVMRLVLVGDPKLIAAQIADQGLGPLDVREPAILEAP